MTEGKLGFVLSYFYLFFVSLLVVLLCFVGRGSSIHSRSLYCPQGMKLVNEHYNVVDIRNNLEPGALVV